MKTTGTIRQRRAREWKQFRRDHLFTQERLAEVLGVSRGTVQNVERQLHDPMAQLEGKFRALKAKHAKGRG